MTLAGPILLTKPETGNGGVLMYDFEALLSDLEWRRIRRRVTMHPAMALLRNCGTLVLILALKLAWPAIAR